MLKLLAAVVLMIGCKGGDKCERLVDKMSAFAARETHEKVDPEKRDKDLAQCRDNIKDPNMAAAIDCLLAIDDLGVDSVSGCMKQGDDGRKQTLAKLTEVRDQMCSCKDAACAKKVNDGLTAWSEEMKKKAPSNFTGAAAEDTSMAIDTCLKKAMAIPAATP
jgi:hypothetical protein